jgi:hypothetical protein
VCYGAVLGEGSFAGESGRSLSRTCCRAGILITVGMPAIETAVVVCGLSAFCAVSS